VRVWSENRIPSESNADFNRLNIVARTLNCWPGRVRTMIPTCSIEEDRPGQAERGIEFVAVAGLRERHRVHAQIFQETVRYGTVRARAIDLQRAAVEQVQLVTQVELVALRMAAEVVVIIEDQIFASGRPTR
jgi:3,4-dihydroxy-2-butanone 4-phosphate synthase